MQEFDVRLPDAGDSRGMVTEAGFRFLNQLDRFESDAMCQHGKSLKLNSMRLQPLGGAILGSGTATLGWHC